MAIPVYTSTLANGAAVDAALGQAAPALQAGDVGTAAAADFGDFATAAQGGLADTAIQPGDIGTAAAADFGDFATAAQGGMADTAVQPHTAAQLGVASDYLDIAADGTPTLVGGATVFDDLLPTTYIQLTGGAAPNITLVGDSSVLRAQEFADSSAAEEMNAIWQIVHAAKVGAAFSPHLHLYVPDDGTGGDIVFSMVYRFTPINGTGGADSAPVYGTLTRAANAGINGNAIVEFDPITPANATISSMFHARFQRVQAGADTFGGTCWLLSADLHIEIDALGSKEEYVK